MSINGHDHDDGALPPDPRLRAALGHAPDHAQRPPAALRDAVLRAAHAAAPQPPRRARMRDASWWQRLFAPGPGALAAVAGVATAGLAINLAWRLSNEPVEAPTAAPPAPAVVAEMRAPAPEVAASGQAGLAQAPPMRAEPSAPPKTAAKRAPPAPAAPVPRNAPRSADAVTTAAAPPISPSTAGSVVAEREAVADARAERARSFEARQAPAAAAPPAAAPAPLAAPPPAAKAAAARPEVPTESLAAPAPPWPAALGRWAQALADGGPEQELPAGWQATTPAKLPAAPPASRRGWWRALLAGTAGRWQATQAAASPGASVWQVRAPDGAAFTLWLDAETIWLQSDGGTWRAPRPAGLAAAP